jgi:hypothetical protein
MKKAWIASMGSLVAMLAAYACGSGTPGQSGPGADGGGTYSGDAGSILTPPSLDSGVSGPTGGACTGLQCQIHACAAGGSTTLSGVVYDPAGNNPLYNVVVYVPNTKPSALPSGASCDSCGSLFTGDPVAAAVTDATGHFTMKNAPDGANLPLVIQVGKWRRQIVLPTVSACQDNPLTNKDQMRLPRNAAEGDLPNIAISTGGADSLECLLLRIGVDKSEYADGPSGSGHIHIFKGSPVPASAGSGLPDPAEVSGNTPSSMASLWDKSSDMTPFDIVLLSCEGEETVGPVQQSLVDYTSAGGRVFASHFHYNWFNSGPFSSASPPLASWTTGANPIEDKTAPGQDEISANIVQSLPDGGPFVKGEALHTWLATTGALTGDELPIYEPKHNADVSATDSLSQEWIAANQNAQTASKTPTSVAGATEYFSFDTPLQPTKVDDAGDPVYCGRVVYSDLHVGAASGDYPNIGTGQPVVPGGCADNPLSPQEKALEFMLFDLSSCVTPDQGGGGAPPVPIAK